MENSIVSALPQCIRISDGKVFNLDKKMTTIGGSSKCRIIITGDQIPPHIAHILFTSGVWTISVISRKPSVLVNNQLLDGTRGLSSGDTISIGTEIFTFTDSNETVSTTVQREKSPLRMLINAMSRFARTADSDVRFELLAAIARLLRADGASLVVENQPDNFITIAHYPQHSGQYRYSRRAILWAKEKGSTIRTHLTDWADSKESKGSLELNSIGSVLCHPLYEGERIRGYLYIDRCTSEDLFIEEDMALLDDAGPVFGDILAIYEQSGRQRETIASLQKSIEFNAVQIIHECDTMKKIIDQAARFGTTDATVLITGETGTGKEVFARFIHQHSNREKKVFCAINCGALPENLIESELFGYERGAFTGATQKKTGLFEQARGGTIFLDEIGEMPLNVQVKLLRALQESEVLPIGALHPVKIDVRILAATNRNLQDEVRNGRFREDLYYRLHVLEIEIPPLRERQRDVLLLSDYFVKKFSGRFGIVEKGLSLSAQARLLGYSWPGNIRELENCIQKAILVSKGSLLTDTDFNLQQENRYSSVVQPEEPVKKLLTLKDARIAAEVSCIKDALKTANGNISVAARLLETDRKWLTKLIKIHGIERW